MEDQYKMIIDKNDVKLFDIPQDEGERNDIAGKLPEVETRMRKEPTDWKHEVMKEFTIATNREKAEQKNSPDKK